MAGFSWLASVENSWLQKVKWMTITSGNPDKVKEHDSSSRNIFLSLTSTGRFRRNSSKDESSDLYILWLLFSLSLPNKCLLVSFFILKVCLLVGEHLFICNFCFSWKWGSVCTCTLLPITASDVLKLLIWCLHQYSFYCRYCGLIHGDIFGTDRQTDQQSEVQKLPAGA